jgi:hypothetical protein
VAPSVCNQPSTAKIFFGIVSFSVKRHINKRTRGYTNILIARKNLNQHFLPKHAFKELRKSSLLDISRWRAVWALTLTLRQCCRYGAHTALHDHRNEQWLGRNVIVSLNEYQCAKAFRHFMNLLNREIYGKASYRYDKRINVVPILEKETNGRWHIHAAIEPPYRMGAAQFENLIQHCWRKTHWGYDRITIDQSADRGWINYMLKPSQKSEFEAWVDCIDWNSLHNQPIVGA